MVEIEESGIIFGPFNKADFFAIESAVQQKKLSSEGISSVEFVVQQNNALIFLEAKSSIPREHEAFFTEIVKKFEHSITVFANALLNRNALHGDLPMGLAHTDCFLQQVKLFLVIRGVPENYLPNMTDKLRKPLTELRKLWGIEYKNIVFLNKERAIQYGLAVGEQS